MTTALSTCLGGVLAVETPLRDAADALQTFVLRFGPVSRECRRGVDDVLGWLLPLASFPSRYVLLPWANWTVLFGNGLYLPAASLHVPMSRAARCRVVHGRWAAGGTLFRLVDGERDVRAITCYKDLDRWFWHQEGEPFEFEKLELYAKRRKRDRLPPEVVHEYLGALMGVQSPPDWRELFSGEAECLERSTHQLQGGVEEYETIIDI